MGHDDDCPSLAVEVLEHVHDLAAGLRIKVAGRLITEQDGRVVHECPGNSDPLLLASREFRGFVFCHFPVNADIGKQFTDPPGGIVAPVPEDIRIFHVLVRGEERDEVELLEDVPDRIEAEVRQRDIRHLPDIPAGDLQGHLSGDIQSSDLVEERGLAGPGRSHDCHELPAIDPDRHVVERDHIARWQGVNFTDIVKFYNRYLLHDRRHNGITAP